MALRLVVWLGGGVGSDWLALALTYTVHASIWTLVAALLTRRKSLASQTRHLAWKVALFAPLATALAAGWPVGPLLDAVPLLGDVPKPVTAHLGSLAHEAMRGLRSDAAAGSNGDARVLGACALAAAALGALRFVGSLWLLSARLRGRRRVTEPAWLERLERLRGRGRAGAVILSESDQLSSPVAIGTREICMPRQLFGALSDAELDAVLAHELAHIERRDGLWFPLVGALQSLLWLQPWNHWVAARYRESAELACDDRATELTGDPVGLARALVQVASLARFSKPNALVPAMAGAARTLEARIGRLLAVQTSPRPTHRGQMFTVAGLCAATLLTAGLGIGLAEERASHTRQEPEARELVGARRASPPDITAQNTQLAALERRRRELETQLESALRLPSTAGTDHAVHLLLLRQEQDHVQATEAWLEQRFAQDWSAWEQAQQGNTPSH